MLQVPSHKLRECCRHAAACSERAKQTSDPAMREFWKEREEFWMNLAQSYELSAQILPAVEIDPDRVH
jgi:hypothetical protein